MNEAIDKFCVQLGAAIDSVESVKRALDKAKRPTPANAPRGKTSGLGNRKSQRKKDAPRQSRRNSHEPLKNCACGLPPYLPRASRFIPRPVRARALTPSEPRTTSRMYPAASSRSRCSSGMVRCIGLLPTSFKDANTSLVSGMLRREKDDNWRLSLAMLSREIK